MPPRLPLSLVDVVVAYLERRAADYPLDMFPDPLPGEHGFSVDACSARAIRTILRSCIKELESGEWRDHLPTPASFNPFAMVGSAVDESWPKPKDAPTPSAAPLIEDCCSFVYGCQLPGCAKAERSKARRTSKATLTYRVKLRDMATAWLNENDADPERTGHDRITSLARLLLEAFDDGRVERLAAKDTPSSGQADDGLKDRVSTWLRVARGGYLSVDDNGDVDSLVEFIREERSR